MLAVLGLVDLVAHPLDHAGCARGTAFVVVRLVARDLGLGPLVGPEALRAVPVHRRGGVGLCNVDVGALTGFAGPDHRGQDAERTEDGPSVDADGDVLGDVGETLLVGRDLHDPGPGVVGHAVARVVAVRTGHAVPRDRAEDDLGVDRTQVLIPHAPT